MKRAYHLLFLSLSFILVQCGGEDEPNPDNETVLKDVDIVSPANGDQFVIGDDIVVNIQVNHPDLIDQLKLYVDDTLYADDLSLENHDFTISTKNSRVGYVNIYIEYEDGVGAIHHDNRQVTIFSDLTPEKKDVQIVNTYQHDKSSYTQGLEFYKGKLYEGTGQKGQSVLAEIDYNTGTKLRSVDLAPDLFGEGITILNDNIYQLTYMAGKCLVYDMSFNKINEFNYQGQGWGLTNNGHQLIMSNGSSQIVWRDPNTFQVVKKIDVFDHQSNVTQLNELELIDGILYANIYTDSRICAIDTLTGKVLSYIDCTPIIAQQQAGADVLNGIAHNHENGKVYLTGKWWQGFYEVKF